MYTKEFFLKRFQDESTDELSRRYQKDDLATEAREAMLEVLKSRGLDDASLQQLEERAKKSAARYSKVSSGCDFCGKATGFSPILDNRQCFCSEECLERARLLESSHSISDEEVYQFAADVKNGPCPQCGRSSSKTEVRRNYRVISVIVFTHSTERTRICCHACGLIANLESLVCCLLLGWWAFPWGWIKTPSKIVANIMEMLKPRNDPAPSKDLQLETRLELARRLKKQSTPESDF